MAVVDPVKVTITNLADGYELVLEAPDFPTHPEKGIQFKENKIILNKKFNI